MTDRERGRGAARRDVAPQGGRAGARLDGVPRHGRSRGRTTAVVAPDTRPPAGAQQRPQRLGEDVHDLLAHEPSAVEWLVGAPGQVVTSAYDGAQVNAGREGASAVASEDRIDVGSPFRRERWPCNYNPPSRQHFRAEITLNLHPLSGRNSWSQRRNGEPFSSRANKGDQQVNGTPSGASFSGFCISGGRARGCAAWCREHGVLRRARGERGRRRRGGGGRRRGRSRRALLGENQAREQGRVLLSDRWVNALPAQLSPLDSPHPAAGAAPTMLQGLPVAVLAQQPL
jgi:hypothetical protein